MVGRVGKRDEEEGVRGRDRRMKGWREWGREGSEDGREGGKGGGEAV